MSKLKILEEYSTIKYYDEDAYRVDISNSCSDELTGYAVAAPNKEVIGMYDVLRRFENKEDAEAYIKRWEMLEK